MTETVVFGACLTFPWGSPGWSALGETPELLSNSKWDYMDRIFKRSFSAWSYIAQLASVSIVGEFGENPNVASVGLGGAVVGRARSFQIVPVARALGTGRGAGWQA
jgi:hypothetical protein